jgi:hypothetical protein
LLLVNRPIHLADYDELINLVFAQKFKRTSSKPGEKPSFTEYP